MCCIRHFQKKGRKCDETAKFPIWWWLETAGFHSLEVICACSGVVWKKRYWRTHQAERIDSVVFRLNYMLFIRILRCWQFRITFYYSELTVDSSSLKARLVCACNNCGGIDFCLTLSGIHLHKKERWNKGVKTPCAKSSTFCRPVNNDTIFPTIKHTNSPSLNDIIMWK